MAKGTILAVETTALLLFRLSEYLFFFCRYIL